MNVKKIKNYDCTGCMTCINVCPIQCIVVEYDKEGFAIPAVDEERCIDCSKCISYCPAEKKVEKWSVKEVYAAQTKEWNHLKDSASGGIAYELCGKAILNKGVAYGAVYDDNLHVCHSRAETVQQLQAQQGSKYVQSDFSTIFTQVEADCKNEREVVVVGTPCQLAGLRNYLNVDYDNLLLIDLICHGVPSQKLFDEYLKWKAKKLRVDKIIDYRFRDKTSGWGTNFKVVSDTKIQFGSAMEEPYYADFELAYSYRESCYKCQYACPERVGDITIGDYWGVLKFHPEASINTTKGVSCILVNTDKGFSAINGLSDCLNIIPSTIDKVIVSNSSLKTPARKPEIRKEYYMCIASENFDWSKKRLMKSKYYYKSWIRRHIPKLVKQTMKQVQRRLIR